MHHHLLKVLLLNNDNMSVESQTQILEQNKKTPEEHVKEVNDLLTETTEEVNSLETDQQADYETTEMYRSTENWESQLGLTLGAVPPEMEDQLSKPERFALGAKILKQKYNMDVTKVGEIKVDGIGDKSTIQANYDINIDYANDQGIQYNIERQNVNARNLDKQDQAQSELRETENIFETVTDEYNQQETSWTYGQNRAQIVADD